MFAGDGMVEDELPGLSSFLEGFGSVPVDAVTVITGRVSSLKNVGTGIGVNNFFTSMFSI